MTQPWQIIRDECMPALLALPSNSVDAVITDPPYSSGGFSRDDKGQETADKYQSSGTARRYPAFSGDSRDQRSYMAWCSLWVEQCVRALKPGGYFLAFTDWRQLPVMTDAVQAGGIFWRGLIAWDKGAGARAPHKGYFKHQCEYIVWGTKGPARQLEHDGPFPGCIQSKVVQSDKFHLTGKPTELMKELVRCVERGGVILDPFAGSGTTGVAAVSSGRRFIGIEREEAYAEISRSRIAAAAHVLEIEMAGLDLV
jgi:site-specific DNA-methyltransferase (adenine-specific)